MTATTSSPAVDSLVIRFFVVIKELANGLAKTYPNNMSLKMAVMTLGLVGSPNKADKAKRSMVAHWLELTKDSFNAIEQCDTEAVADLFDNDSNPLVSGIGVGKILNDPAVSGAEKDKIWAYLNTLTKFAMQVDGKLGNLDEDEDTDCEEDGEEQEPEGVPNPAPVAPATGTAAAPATAPTPPVDLNNILQGALQNLPKMMEALNQAPTSGSGPAGSAPPLDLNNILQGAIQNLPKMMEFVNEFLQTQDGENPIMDMVKQILNPNEMNSGLMSNIVALAQSESNTHGGVMGSVKAKTGLDEQQIMDRLERYEKLKRRSRR